MRLDSSARNMTVVCGNKNKILVIYLYYLWSLDLYLYVTTVHTEGLPYLKIYIKVQYIMAKNKKYSMNLFYLSVHQCKFRNIVMISQFIGLKYMGLYEIKYFPITHTE